jgi:hypothetical protein
MKIMNKLHGNVGAITLVLTGVTIIIGVVVFYNIYINLPQNCYTTLCNTGTAAENASAFAIGNVSTQFAASIQLLTVGLIVLAAAVVLGYLFLIRG